MNNRRVNQYGAWRVSRVLPFAVLCLAPAVVLAAHSADMPSPDEAWLKQSEAIMGQALEHRITPGAHITNAQRQWAKEIMRGTQMGIDGADDEAIEAARNVLLGNTYDEHRLPEWGGGPAKPVKPDTAPENKVTIRVFTTLGKGDAGRRRFVAQVRALAGYDGAEVLLRGLPSGMRHIGELIRLLRTLTAEIDNAPAVKLAPLVFRKASVAVAPTVVYYQGNDALARLSGSLEIGWLKDQVADGKRGELGARGPVHEIAERNLMAEIRSRWQAMDWAKVKSEALADYWDTRTPTDLPEAEKARTFKVDPSVIVARTLRTPRGKVIARKGQRINPLEIVPFTGAIIAFDGSDTEQVKLAGRLIERVRADGLRPIPVTQGLPGHMASFENQAKLEQTLASQVYLLDARIVSRFQIKALPAVVRSKDNVFVVRELNPKAALLRLARSGGSDADTP